jgi:hypothetical protein
VARAPSSLSDGGFDFIDIEEPRQTRDLLLFVISPLLLNQCNGACRPTVCGLLSRGAAANRFRHFRIVRR